MSAWFTSASSLWLGLLIGPLLLLYMLRHKPIRKRMPSILLWRGVARSQIATSPFQRLRRSLSLLLMLLALVCLVLALAGMRIPGGEARGVPLTLVVDVTASMSSFEKGGRRLDLAKQRARQVIDDAGNSAVSLFSWDGNLHSLAPADSEPAAAKAALDKLEVAQYGAADTPLLHAIDRLSEASNRRVVLVSDHAPGDMKSALFVPAGLPKMNVGFVSASLSEITAKQVDLFFGLDLHGSDHPVKVPLVLERVAPGGKIELVDARDVTVQPDQRGSVTFSNVEPGLYRARIKVEDGMALDNEAYLRYSRLPVQEVVLTGQPPEPVKRAVAAIQDSMGIIHLAEAGSEDQANCSYVLCDKASNGIEPRLPSAFLAPACAPPGVSYGTAVKVPDAATRPADSFLWRGAGTPDIRVPSIYPVNTDRFTRPVLEAGSGSAISLIPRDDGLQDMLLSFPLDNTATGFTGKLAFVIFWANWFDYVRRSREPLPRGAVTTLQSVQVRPLLGRGDFSYGLADAKAEATSPGRVLHLDRTGIYRFEGLPDTDLPLLGVSLLDASESNLTLAPSKAYDAGGVSAWMQGFQGEGEHRDLDLRPWLALLAAGLLLFEWFWFRRKFAVPRLDTPKPGGPAPASPKTRTLTRPNTSRARA